MVPVVWLLRVLSHWLLQDGKTTAGRRGDDRAGRDGSAAGAPCLPRYGTKFFGSLFMFGDPAIFQFDDWRDFVRYHRRNDDVSIHELSVLARFRNFLERLCGKKWDELVLSEYGEVLLFDIRVIFTGYLGLKVEQMEEFVLVMENWPPAVFRLQMTSLVEARGFLCQE